MANAPRVAGVTESVCTLYRCRGCHEVPIAFAKTFRGGVVEVTVRCPNGCATGAEVFEGTRLRVTEMAP